MILLFILSREREKERKAHRVKVGVEERKRKEEKKHVRYNRKKFYFFSHFNNTTKLTHS
jgi:hypothetical protein